MSRRRIILVLTRQVKRAKLLPGAIAINIEPDRIFALIKSEILLRHRPQIKTNFWMQQSFAEIAVGIVPKITEGLMNKA
jgi:hypothetical protein